LHRISPRRYIEQVIIDAPRAFWDWLDRLEEKAAGGDEHARMTRLYALAELRALERLEGEPTEETPTLKRVRQSRRYPLWRVAHPFVDGLAVRTIAWFPPGRNRVVVAVLAGEKAAIGDVFYDSVATRADAAIDQYLYERQGESDDEE
jgi:hypothetical protein